MTHEQACGILSYADAIIQKMAGDEGVDAPQEVPFCGHIDDIRSARVKWAKWFRDWADALEADE